MVHLWSTDFFKQKPGAKERRVFDTPGVHASSKEAQCQEPSIERKSARPRIKLTIVFDCLTEDVQTPCATICSWKMHEGLGLVGIMMNPGEKGPETHREHVAVVRRRPVSPPPKYP